jgi:hypothetical protein
MMAVRHDRTIAERCGLGDDLVEDCCCFGKPNSAIHLSHPSQGDCCRKMMCCLVTDKNDAAHHLRHGTEAVVVCAEHIHARVDVLQDLHQSTLFCCPAADFLPQRNNANPANLVPRVEGVTKRWIGEKHSIPRVYSRSITIVFTIGFRLT